MVVLMWSTAFRTPGEGKKGWLVSPGAGREKRTGRHLGAGAC